MRKHLDFLTCLLLLLYPCAYLHTTYSVAVATCIYIPRSVTITCIAKVLEFFQQLSHVFAMSAIYASMRLRMTSTFLCYVWRDRGTSSCFKCCVQTFLHQLK